MRNIIILLIVIITSLMAVNNLYAQQNNSSAGKPQLPPLTGKVEESEYYGRGNQGEPPTGFIKDSLTGKPLDGAVISVPDKNLSTLSKADGSFNLDIEGHGGSFILSVKKEGYVPFAIDAGKIDFNRPFTLHVEQLSGHLVIDNDLHHIGDNNFSAYSANASSFRLPAEGPTFIKEFYVEALPPKGMILTIGSIIGLDTIASKQMGQSQISTYSSPLSVFVNSVKIAEIALNADNKRVPIHNGVLKPHSKNLLVLQSGTNQVLALSGGIDYDDIEFMNVILETVK